MEKMNMLLMLPIANVHWNDFSWDSCKGTNHGLRHRDSRDSRDSGTPKTSRLWDSGKGTIHGLRLRDSRDSRDSGVMVMEVDKVADEVTGMEVL